MRQAALVVTFALASGLASGLAAAQDGAAVPASPAAPAAAQMGGTDVESILTTPTKPLTLNDLPDDYRAITLGSGTSDLFGGMGSFYGLAMMGASAGMNTSSTAETTLFTLMGAYFVSPKEFSDLLAGRVPRIRAYTLSLTDLLLSESSGQASVMDGASVALPSSAPNAPATGAPMEGPMPPTGRKVPMPIFTEVWLEAGRVAQWSARPGLTKASLQKVFAPEVGPDGTTTPAGAQTMALSQLKQVALATLMYTADYDDRYPLANSSAKAQELVMPYARDAKMFKSLNPNGGRLLYNTYLNGSEAALPSPSETLLWWDEQAWPDGGRPAAFADGHVRLLSEAEWSRYWRQELERRQALREGRAPRPGMMPKERAGEAASGEMFGEAIPIAPSPTRAEPARAVPAVKSAPKGKGVGKGQGKGKRRG